jgi:uncharacterized delta-60 repeat protein
MERARTKVVVGSDTWFFLIEPKIAAAFVFEQLERRLLWSSVLRTDATLAADALAAIEMPVGAKDEPFGANGIARIDALDQDSAQALIRQADGKMVLAGWTSHKHNRTEYWAGQATSITLLRLNADGTIDRSFGVSGFARFDLATPRDHGEVIPFVEQADGKLLVGGEGLHRFTADGVLDQSFGQGGAALEQGAVQSIALQADGRIVIGDKQFNLQRYNADGSLDATFGNAGSVSPANLLPPGSNSLRTILVQPDGRIVAFGTLANNDWQTWKFEVARYNADGTLDTTFGDGGVSQAGEGFEGSAAALQADGKIVAVGTGPDGGVLARFNADGTLDESFGDSGLAAGAGSYATNLLIQPDGKILVSGGYGGEAAFRFNTDGTPDATFGVDGRFNTRIAAIGNELSEGAYALALEPDGDVLLVGQVELGNIVIGPTDRESYDHSDFMVMRLSSDGRPVWAPEPEQPAPAPPAPVIPGDPTEPGPPASDRASNDPDAAARTAEPLAPRVTFAGEPVAGAFDFDDPTGKKNEFGEVEEVLPT